MTFCAILSLKVTSRITNLENALGVSKSSVRLQNLELQHLWLELKNLLRVHAPAMFPVEPEELVSEPLEEGVHHGRAKRLKVAASSQVSLFLALLEGVIVVLSSSTAEIVSVIISPSSYHA
jgi:hypothetical protein